MPFAAVFEILVSSEVVKG